MSTGVPQPCPAPRVVIEPGATLAESPCWDVSRDELLWVDIPAGRVHAHGPQGSSRWEFGRPVGSVQLCDDGRLLVCAQGALILLDRVSDDRELLCLLEPADVTMRPNDAACDPAGRLWVGTTRLTHDAPVGGLYQVDGNGRPRRMVGGLTCSNGIAWNPEGTVMYLVDSALHRVDRFDFDAGVGELSGRRQFATLDDAPAQPDGVCVDVDGGVWVALWDGGAVRRYDATGRPTAELTLPVSRVSSCCFGGADGGDLFVTTAKAPGDNGLGGAVFSMRPGIHGLRTHRFGGVTGAEGGAGR